jgi:ribosomal protein L40E
MVKFAEANARLYKNIFICRRCKSKIRTSMMRVLAGKVKCRKCNYAFVRPVRKK